MAKSTMTPEQRITRARTRLLINQPFFGTLALRMRIVKTAEVPTMANNGTILYYNEDYLATLTDPQLQAVLAHEVMHCAMGHMYRAGTRDHMLWNVACDYAINPILKDANFDFPPGVLLDDKFRNMPAEQIYALLQKEAQANGGGNGHGPCDCGLQPAPKNSSSEPDPNQMTQTDWQVLAQQAAETAKKAGRLPADLEFLIQASHQAKTDWRSILRRFITQTIPSDYSWASPNRRFIAQGLYLPGMVKENAPRIGIAVDTSGSIGGPLLQAFAAEITTIVHEVRPEQVDVIYCDADIQGRETFTPDDPEIILHAKGGGGTSFAPALDEFSKDPPACVIYLTDGYASWPAEPEYPVLWAITESSSVNEVPFGEFVKISEHD